MNEEQELPQGWVWARLGEIASTSSGGTPSRSNPSYFTGNIPWIKSGELGDGYVTEHSESISEAALADSSAKLFPKGTLLIALYGATVGKVGILTMNAATNQAVCGIFLPPWVELKFAFNYLFSLRREFIEQGKGGAQPNISQDIVRNTPFPLPPLPEQRRIVAKLEELFSKLDAGVAAVRRTQALLKRYRQSVLHAAVTGELTRAWRKAHPPAPAETGAALLQHIRAERRAQWEAAQVAKRGGQLPLGEGWKAKYAEPEAMDTAGLPELPEGWVWATTEQLCEISSGQTPKGVTEVLGNGTVPWFRVGDMNLPGNEYQLLTSSVYLTEAEVRALSITLRPAGTIVFPKRGGAIATNKKRILGQPSAFDLNVMGLKPVLIENYFWYWFQQIDLGRISDGSNVPQINNGDILPLPVPLPPLAEQAEIVAEVERRLTVLDALSQTLTYELRRAERLRQSILHRAFTGRLVLQEATDEPAAALLARLRDTPAAPAKTKVGRKTGPTSKQLSIKL